MIHLDAIVINRIKERTAAFNTALNVSESWNKSPESQSQAASQLLSCLEAEAPPPLLFCLFSHAHGIPKPSTLNALLNLVGSPSAISFPLSPSGTCKPTDSVYNVHTHNEKRKGEEQHMPGSAGNYSHPHINTHAEKIEIHKSMYFCFLFVHPTAEVLNHNST